MKYKIVEYSRDYDPVDIKEFKTKWRAHLYYIANWDCNLTIDKFNLKWSIEEIKD